MYFKDFPNMFYEFIINGTPVLKSVKDITTNVRVRTEILANITLYDLYDIRDGDTPEIIAAKYYGDPNLHWTIMLANDKFDYLNDFPMNYEVLVNYIRNKYNIWTATSWLVTDTSAGPEILADVVSTLTYEGTAGTNDIEIENAYVNVTNTRTGEVVLTREPALDGPKIITDSSEGSITFIADNYVGEYTQDGILYTKEPAGNFTIRSFNEEYKIKHYEKDGFVVLQNEIGATPVNFYDYEIALNESKRSIKLIHPSIISRVVGELGKLI